MFTSLSTRNLGSVKRIRKYGPLIKKGGKQIQ